MAHGGAESNRLTDFRWREDDGSETGATWNKAVNTNADTLVFDRNYRLRLAIENQGTGGDVNLLSQLQYRVNGGTWTDVTTTSSNVRATTSSNFTDGDDTTQQITSFTYDSANSGMSEDGTAGAGNQPDLAANEGTEFEWCFQFRSADLSYSDYVEFRCLDNGATLTGGYAYTPRCDFVAPISITPPRVDLALSTTAPLRSVNYNITVPADDLSITTTPPYLDFGFTIPADDLSLTSVAPHLDFGFTIPTGDLTLDSIAPEVTVPIEFTIPAVDLSLSTTAPGVRTSIEVPSADLALTSQLRISDLSVIAYRWREDDGSESTATWREPESQGTIYDYTDNDLIRLRFLIRNDSSNTVETPQLKLYRNKDWGFFGGNLSFSLVNSGVDDWALVDTANLTLGDDTTQQLGSGTFITNNDGQVDGQGGGSATWNCPVDIDPGEEVEIEFAIQSTEFGVGGIQESSFYIFKLIHNLEGINTELRNSVYPCASGRRKDQVADTKPVFPYASTRESNEFFDGFTTARKLTARIDSSEITAGEDYLILYNGSVDINQGSATDNVNSKVKIGSTGTIIANVDCALNTRPFELQNGMDNIGFYGFSIGGFYVASSLTVGDIYFEAIQSTGAVPWRHGHGVMALPLTHWNQNSDYWLTQNNSDTPDVTINTTTFTNTVSLTFTPPADGNYLVMYSVEMASTDTSNEIEIRPTKDGSIITGYAISKLGQTSSYEAYEGFSYVVDTNLTKDVSVTLALQARNAGTSDAKFRRGRVLAIRLDSFAESSVDSEINDATSTNWASVDTWAGIASNYTSRDTSTSLVLAFGRTGTSSAPPTGNPVDRPLGNYITSNVNSNLPSASIPSGFSPQGTHTVNSFMFGPTKDQAGVNNVHQVKFWLSSHDTGAAWQADMYLTKIAWQKQILPDAEDLILSTTAPTVVSGASPDITSPADDLVLNSTAPIVYISINIEIPADDLVISTTAPDKSFSYNITVPAADLAVTTTAPDVMEEYYRILPADDLVIDSVLPTVTVTDNHTRAPPAEDIAISSTAPTVSVNYNFTPASADLALTGLYPLYKQIVLWQTDGLSRGTVIDLASATGNAPAILPRGLELTEFGSPGGTKTQLVSISGGSVPYDGIVLQSAPGEPGLETIQPGIWEIGLNITQGNSNITLKEVRVYTYDPHAKAVDTLLASDTNVGISLATTGQKTVQLVGTSGTHLTDLILVVFTFINTGVLPEEFAFVADLPIFGPLFRDRIVKFIPTADISSSSKAPTFSYANNIMVAAAGGMGMGGGGMHHNVSIDIQSAAMAFSNKTDTVTQTENHFITPPADDLTIDSVNPTAVITANHFADPPADDLSITTTIPETSINIIIDTPADSLQISTNAPVVSTAFNIGIPNGTLALTTTAPFAIPSVPVPAADLTITTTNPAVTTSANHPISVPAGDLALTETAPSVTEEWFITIPADDLVISTEAPTASTNINITLPSGDIALSTEAPTVTLSIEIPADDLVISSVAPSVSVGFVITIPADDLTLDSVAPSARESIEVPADDLAISTIAPSVVWTDNHFATPPADDLALTGTAPSVSVGFVITIPSDNLLFFTGTPVARTSIEVPADDLAISTTAPSVVWTDNHFATPPADDLTLTGTAPALGEGINITLPVVDLTLTGSTPGVRSSIEVPRVDLTISSTAPSASVDYRFEIPAADLLLTVVAPSVGLGIGSVAGDLNLTTTAPSISIGYNITIPADDLTLTGSAPVISESITVPVADLALSTTAPSVVWTDNHFVTPPTGALTLSTVAPQLGGATNIQIPTDDLTISSTAPTIIWTDNVFIAVPADDLVISTAAPSVSTGYYITVPADDLAISTTAPVATPSEEVPAGDLVTSTTAPTIDVTSGLEITVPAADLSLLTTAPVSSVGFSIVVPSVNIVLQTQAPLVSVSITVPVADLTVTTETPTVQLNTVITIPNTDLIFSSLAPEVSESIVIQIPNGNISISTDIPQIGESVAIQVPTGNLSLTGQAPILRSSIEVAAADLAFSSSAPTVRVSVEVPQAALILSTTAPLVAVSIELPSATLGLSTTAPSVVVAFNISVPAADLSLATTAPLVAESEELAAAQLTLSTTAPTVRLGIVIPSTDLTLDGPHPQVGIGLSPPGTHIHSHSAGEHAPTIDIDTPITVPYADLVLTTTPPLFAESEEIPVAQLVLSTTPPLVGEQYFLEIPTAQLTLFTTAPTVIHETDNVTIPAAQLLLTNGIPVVDQTFDEFFRPAAAQLTITTHAPRRSVLPYRSGFQTVESCEPNRAKISNETHCVGSPVVTKRPQTSVDTED